MQFRYAKDMDAVIRSADMTAVGVKSARQTVSATVQQQRNQAWQRVQNGTFDVAIIGAGVAGSALFRELAERGYRVLLLDRADFASGTSQASGMLIWGGLLYLKNLDLITVRQLSKARDALIREHAPTVKPAAFRYLSRRHGARSPWLVRAALEAYWWLGTCQRKRPSREKQFDASSLLDQDRFGDSLTYEEAHLPMSDACLVSDWISTIAPSTCVAINHCELIDAQIQSAGSDSSMWTLRLKDCLLPQVKDRPLNLDVPHSIQARARVLVNAAGVWADGLNQRIGLSTEHRHVFSKGVYLGLPRPPKLREFLAFEMGAHGDTLTYTPWGPIALWGPTETPLQSLTDAFSPNADDVQFLLKSARENLRAEYGAEDIISMRCGVRPLAVQKSYRGNDYPLDLSRRCVVDVDHEKRGMTMFGGKITSAQLQAKKAALEVQKMLGDAKPVHVGELPRAIPSDMCATLDDYLRRRTNIAQWTPRLGLGRENENRGILRQFALRFHGELGADAALSELETRADAQDNLLRQIQP
jgi:glycerol-3-phosphate dehydrogenase